MSEQLDQNIALIHTSCKNCVFAQYEYDMQVGCSANMFEKFTNADIDIVPVYDNDKEFMVINSTCMMKRPEAWDRNFESQEERIVTARAEAKIKYQAIVVITHDSITDFEKTINQLLAQDIQPKHIAVLNPSFVNMNKSKVFSILQNSGIKWKFQDLSETNIKVMKWITNLLHTQSYPFISIFYQGLDIPQNTFKRLDEYINDELQTFVSILPNSKGHGYIIPFSVYSFFNLNVFDKTFDEFVEQHKCQTISINQLVKDFPE